MTITVNHEQARAMLSETLRARQVLLMKGPPGLGKSAIYKSVAQEFKLKLIDLRLSQCQPSDLLGMPDVTPNGKACYRPMDTFPLVGDPIPAGYNGWLLFLDELTSAVPAIQAASYKLILDRQVGMFDLHERCLVGAAGNRDIDNAIVEDMSTALQSRLVHCELELNHQGLLNHFASIGLDHRISDYIKAYPDAAYTFKPDHTDCTYACPRTWEMANPWIKDHAELSQERLPILAGTLSEGVARGFIGFCQVYKDLPTIAQITQSPQTTTVPDEPAVKWALTGVVARAINAMNSKPLITYMKRMPREFQIITLRETSRRHPTIKQDPAFQSWLTEFANVMF